MSLQRKPSIVLVHGLWADGSCFSKLIPTLLAEGHEVIASQHGLGSHAEDVANVKRTLKRVSSPVVLVGHSYGGSVITAAGTDPRVALVYIAAFAPDADETTQRPRRSSRRQTSSRISTSSLASSTPVRKPNTQ